MGYLVTCEHGSNRIPAEFASVLNAVERETGFVRDDGFDVGAKNVARRFANRLGCPLVEARYSPLLIDCNRSIGHRKLFSGPMRGVAESDRQSLIHNVHFAHRKRVQWAIDSEIRGSGQVVHLAVHSFAPFEPNPTVPADGVRFDSARRTDLGLLYDPARPLERNLCADWYEMLYESLPMIRVRRNYPVRGTRDGLTQSLRKQYAPDAYLGIELQLNQAWCVRELPISHQVLDGILDALVLLGHRKQCSAA